MPPWSNAEGVTIASSSDQVRTLSKFVRIGLGLGHQGSKTSQLGDYSDETYQQVRLTRTNLIGRTKVANSQIVETLKLGIEPENIETRARRIRIPNQANREDRHLINSQKSDIRLEGGRLRVDQGKENNPFFGLTWFKANSRGNSTSSLPVGTKRFIVSGLYDRHVDDSPQCSNWHEPYETNTAFEKEPSVLEPGSVRTIRGEDFVWETRRIRSAQKEMGIEQTQTINKS